MTWPMVSAIGAAGIALAIAVLASAPAHAQAAPQSDVQTRRVPTRIVPLRAGQTALPLPSGSFSPDGTGETTQAATGSVVERGNRALGAYQRGFYLTALKIALPLATLGDPGMQTLVGEIYGRGLGVGRSEVEAARWFKSAASAGRPDAQFQYALLLIQGRAVPQDMAKARDLMKAAADGGIAQAAFNYGQLLIEASPESGFEEARPYFEQAAKAGIPDAQYAMAQIYEYGRGVSDPDPAVARDWLSVAAANGHDAAGIELGIWLVNGRGGPANPREGFNWLRRAAERGNPIAMNRVAHLYKDGIGVAADKIEAGKWSVLAKRAENTDTELDEFVRTLDNTTKKAALDAANRFRSG